MSRSPSPAPRPLDRQTTTPFLLKFCYRQSAFHNLTEFQPPSSPTTSAVIPTHLQIYTWPSCTLRELALLLTSSLPGILPDPSIGTRLSFRLVFPDTSSFRRREGRLEDSGGRGRYTSKEMGSIVVSAPENQSNGNATKRYDLGGDDAGRTLADVGFVVGDYVDCAIFPPLSDGSVVPLRSTGPGGRPNGFGRGRGGYAGGGRGGGSLPNGDWRKGERLPDAGGYRGGSGGGYGRGGGRRGPY